MQLLEAEKLKQAVGANADRDVKPNKRFRNFNDLFSNLTKSKNVVTLYPIVSCMITYNSKLAITVTMRDDREYYVKHYSLESYNMTFEERVGGGKTDYIKLKEVEQNAAGDFYAIAYMNDGMFKIRTFGAESRTKEAIEEEEFDVNEALGLDDYTMPIDNFPDPFITCCFVTDETLFVNLFHSKTLTHHHFFYHLQSREVSEHTTVALKASNQQNFPYKCFYSEEESEVWSFYRQGQSFRVPVTQACADDLLS